MESLKLNIAAVISQHVHHQLQILGPTDVLGHDSEVVSVQKKFSQELKYNYLQYSEHDGY